MTPRASSNLLVIGVLLAAASCKSGPEEGKVTPEPGGPAPITEQPSAAMLEGTSWRLVQFRGGDETILTPDDKEKYTVAFEDQGRLSAQIDCNQGTGTWKSPGPGQLEFSPLAMTMAACLQPAPLNERMPKQWQYVRSYVMKDGHLFLSLMADGGIYEFEPVVEGTLKGTAMYRERMALPPGAVFEATLQDVSKADAPAEVLGSTRLEGPGNPPIRFEIRYDPARIEPRHSYAVRARILVDGKPFFITDQHYPVLTRGKGNRVELMLRRAN